MSENIKLYTLLLIFLINTNINSKLFSTANNQEVECQSIYMGCNRIVYDTLIVSQISGKAVIDKIDVSGEVGPADGICISLLTEHSHKQIISVITDKQGKFSLPNIPPGKYWLIAQEELLSPAIAKVKVVKKKKEGKSKNMVVIAHMKIPTEIDDVCSYFKLSIDTEK